MNCAAQHTNRSNMHVSLQHIEYIHRIFDNIHRLKLTEFNKNINLSILKRGINIQYSLSTSRISKRAKNQKFKFYFIKLKLKFTKSNPL